MVDAESQGRRDAEIKDAMVGRVRKEQQDESSGFAVSLHRLAVGMHDRNGW